MEIDFREIPQANESNGNQDTFECFARDFFKSLGFKIIRDIGRGSDDRVDLIISEKVSGLLSSHEKKYLVSCKHYAHSKNQRAVGNSDESDILGRLRINNCNGFIGFYSTIASSSLVREVENLEKNSVGEHKTYEFIDKSIIFSLLIQSDATLKVFKKYFPESFIKYIKNDLNSEIYKTEPKICCKNCGINILDNMDGSVIRIQSYKRSRNNFDNNEGNFSAIHDLIFSCDDCENQVSDYINNNYQHCSTIRWLKIISYTDQKFFINRTMEDIKFTYFFSDYFVDINAFRKWSIFTRSMFYYVSRKYDIPENKNASLFMKEFLDFSETYNL